MWQCPKCGRAFKNQNQDHFCNEPPKTIDAYIAAQPESVQPFLNQVRDTIRAVLPDAQERISWSMPTYWSKHNIIHFAAFKKHIGLYPGDKAIENFGDRLKEYKTSKGAVQLPYDKPLPLKLIAEIANWCYETGNHHLITDENVIDKYTKEELIEALRPVSSIISKCEKAQQ